MSAPTPPQPGHGGWMALLRQHALLTLMVGPVALLVAIRWWLNWQVDRLAAPLPPALNPAGDPVSLWLTVVLVAAGCVLFGLLAWWLVRKPGPLPRWLRGAAVAAWVLVWLAGSAQALRSHLNVLGAQAGRTEVLRLVGLKAIAPSLRSVGGARLYLDWPAQGGLHTVLIASPGEALLRQPERVQLQVSPGRWQGWFVTGWSLDGVLPAPGSEVSVDAPRDKATP